MNVLIGGTANIVVREKKIHPSTKTGNLGGKSKTPTLRGKIACAAGLQ